MYTETKNSELQFARRKGRKVKMKGHTKTGRNLFILVLARTTDLNLATPSSQ